MFEIQKNSSDFASAINGIDFCSIQNAIWLDNGITTLFHGCRSENNYENIYFVFDSEPSAGEKTILDGIVSAHIGKPAEPSDLQKAKEKANRFIDESAGDARARYITVAAGQDAVYVEKAKQAQSYKNAGYPVDESGYEFITAEKNAQAVSSTVAADTILATANGWKALAASIEEIRIGFKNQINAAADINSVISIQNKGRATLDMI